MFTPNRLTPDENAQGDHTVVKFDNENGQIRSYETFTPNTNPQNPNPWRSVLRVDLLGAPHYNNVIGQSVPTPHVNGSDIPGGVRPATSAEIPKR